MKYYINKMTCSSYREFLREAQVQYNDWSLAIDKLKKIYNENDEFDCSIKQLDELQLIFNHYINDLNNLADEKWDDLKEDVEQKWCLLKQEFEKFFSRYS